MPMPVRHYASGYARLARSRLQHSRIVAGKTSVKMKVPRVVAVHFPKAAGSSLVQQFGAVLKSQMAVDYAADPLAHAAKSRAFPAGKSIVIGHFRPDRYDGADAFRMTFLRHPVANVISTYYFWKTIPDRSHLMHHQFLRDRPSLLAFARDPRIRYLMSQTYFSGYDMTRFDFIGFDETRSADLAALSGLLGINLCDKAHVNRTDASAEYQAAQGDQRLHAALADILADDIDFYERLRAQAAR